MENAPGWYPDPDGNGQRYWDGFAWGLVAPPSQPPPPSSAATPIYRRLWPWLIVAGVLVGAVVLASVFLLVPMSHRQQTSAAESTPSSALPSPPGTAVRDGRFEFVITGIAPATWYGNPRPAGQYLMVSMEIHNVGDGPQTFFVENQRLIDDKGRQYAPAMDAMMVMSKGATSRDLNPGFGLALQIPYDVPRGTRPAAMELHDSMLSSGARVGL